MTNLGLQAINQEHQILNRTDGKAGCANVMLRREHVRLGRDVVKKYA